MRRPLGLLAALALAGLLIWGLRAWLWPDEQARVRAAAGDLAHAVTGVGAARQGLELVGALNTLRPLLEESVTLEASERTLRVQGRDQVLGLASRLAGAASAPTLSLDDVLVTMSGEGQTALMRATATWRSQGQDGQAALDAMEVELEFARHDVGWVLRSAHTVDVLR